MHGNSLYSNKKNNSFRSWVDNELEEIRYQLREKAKDFIANLAEGPFDGDLKLNTSRWAYLSSKNKKEGYKGSEEIDENGIPVIKLTYNSFKHGGYTQSFNSKLAIKELWEQKKSGFFLAIQKSQLNNHKKTNSKTNEENELKNILAKELTLWNQMSRAGESIYLTQKKLPNLKGIRFDESFIAVRIINIKSEFCGLQKIYNDGRKLFTKGLNKKGNFAIIGSETLPEKIERINLCEGIATAGSIHLATLEPVFAALDAFNLEPVSKNLKEKYPKAKIIIWADNDQWKAENLDLKGSKIGNTGLIHANYATMLANNALVVTPDFNHIFELAKEKRLTDFNDLHVYSGLETFSKLLPKESDINLGLSKKIRKLERVYHGLLSTKQLHDGQKITVNNKFLTDIEIEEGVNLIRSPIGTGKTEIVEKYIKNNKDKSVIFLTHLVSLIEDAASRLELKSYSECDSFDLQMQRRIAICLNSIGKLTIEGDLPSYDILVIDEIEQVLNRLSTKLEQKTLIFSIFKQLIVNTKTVICLDAHLSDTTMSIIKRWCSNKKVNVIFNEYKVGQGRDIILYSHKENLQIKAIHELQQGQNAYLTFNSKNEAKKTHYLIQKSLPNKKGLFISSDNNGDQEVKDFFSNVNEESKKYDYIICTPSISTGVSISNNHFNFVAGIFNSDINTPNDCMQAIGRVRNSSKIHIYTEKRKANRPLDPKIIARKWNETHKYDLDLMGLSEFGERIVICPDYEFIRTKTTQNKNRGINNFFYEFCLLNKLDGYNIVHSDFSLAKEERAVIKQIKSYIAKSSQQTDIVNAENINATLANIIENKARKKLEESLSFEKHKLIEFYNLNRYDEQEIKDFVLLDDNNKLKAKVLNLELALSTQDHAIKLFNKQLDEYEQFSPDLKHFATTQELYKRLLKELMVINDSNELLLNFSDNCHIYNKEILINSNFFKWLKANHDILTGIINLPSMDKIIAEPIRFISKLLSDLGLKQKRIGKNEYGNYSIDKESLTLMVALLERRHYFKGDSCSINIVNNTHTVPLITVPDILNNLKSVIHDYCYYLTNKFNQTKSKFDHFGISISKIMPITV